MPQVNPATIALLLVAALGGAWAAGLVRPQYAESRLTLRVWRAGRVVASLDLRDTWLLLALALVMGWAVAAAVERSAWAPDTEGRLVPAMALASVLGWIFVCAGLRRLGYGIASLGGGLVSLALLTPSPLTTPGFSIPALGRWLLALPGQTNLLLLIGLLLMFGLAGVWTSWWIFRRRNGLVALLPTGTILAVEIINDTSPGLGFFVVVWLGAAASVLLRLNFVALKNGWRTRRLPHAADTGWTFGEVGLEATVAILAVAFLILPPLSNNDISGWLIPGVVHADSFHPFGIGSGAGPGGTIGSIGYSELVRPGSQLKAKSQTVMVVSGDSPLYYPYWRGIALAGWDGIAWYKLPSTQEVPVRQQPLLAAHATLPRDDLPVASQRIQVLHDSFRVVVGQDQTLGTVFSGGEVVSVDQVTTVRGIMTSVPAPVPGPIPGLVNVSGDSTGTASFDTVDQIRLVKRLQPPYTYTVTEAIPNVDVADLKTAGTDYPAWLAPYTTLYEGGLTAQGYSTARDAEIAALAQSIVQAVNATTPYDQAKAIESWFLVKDRFTYTLKPPETPVGVRPLDYFLFNSRKGFCQDFSSAMNVMLRTLGIPSRQMSGFGQGVFDQKTRQYSVNALDAHSWVEVFFPGYGWIPFEATPDGINGPINRPATRADLNAPIPAAAGATPRNFPNLREPAAVPGLGTSSTAFPDLWRPILIAAGGLLLLLLIAMLLALRWLLAVKDVPRIWRRLLFLGDRLKVPRHAGDTPQEFGGRLAASVPPLDAEVRRLATLYTRARFRHGGLSVDELADARRAWHRIRASYPTLVATAWRDALRHGRVVSAEEGAGSESREPSRRH
ncbi:MAG TPA: transglutaminaseTgpA domain-containing protein [Candidatus Dormibacteraeota bacterium]|nr:transglutaminaseTgpA domain-containing protein [Candidatus Dormibacteraeota bacterium]